MVRHQPYFDALSSIEPDVPSFDPTVAGLAVLSLVDAAREDARVIDSDWTGVRAATEAVWSLREGKSIRRHLVGILDELRGHPLDWSAVNKHLFGYGRALDIEGSWTLAVDVFGTVAEIARADRHPELAIEATTALGGAARRSGDWDRSAEGYAEAAHLADALGDKASGLTVRVGTANNEIARGNLPGAQEILDEVIAEAVRSGLNGVAALAYHSSATVAHHRGNFGGAVTMAYKALEKTTNPAVKDTIMADIGAAFQDLGMRDAARDAQLVVSLTSRYQWVRWQASINLMEMAALDGIETAFDDYAAQLRNEALDPRLRSYFLLYYGQGCIGFGRLEEGMKSISEAQRFAASHRINQVSFEAERALSEAAAEERRVHRAMTATVWAESVSPDVLEVARAVAHIREAALSSPAAGDWQ